MATDDLLRLRAAFRSRTFDPTQTEAAARRRLDGFALLYQLPAGVTVEALTLAGRPAERLCAGDGPRLLYLHGGGFVTGSLASHRHMAGRLAAELRGTVDVLEYRLAPEATFPAAPDDCLAAFAVLAREGPVAIAGDSAGGNLALATAVAARDAGLRPPIAVVALSPWVNLCTDNASFDLLGPVDLLLSRAVAEWHVSRYLAAGAARDDPRASPLFANLAGLPPVLVQVGDHEVFFGDAVLLHQRLIAAGVNTTLSVAKGMFHVWHLYWPTLAEGEAALVDAAAFIRAHA